MRCSQVMLPMPGVHQWRQDVWLLPCLTNIQHKVGHLHSITKGPLLLVTNTLIRALPQLIPSRLVPSPRLHKAGVHLVSVRQNIGQSMNIGTAMWHDSPNRQCIGPCNLTAAHKLGYYMYICNITSLLRLDYCHVMPFPLVGQYFSALNDAHTQTSTDTHTQTDPQTHRVTQTHTHTHTQTHRRHMDFYHTQVNAQGTIG